MKPGATLKLVEEPPLQEPTLDEIRERSARQGKHLSDAMRLTIMARNWNAVHVAGDRRSPVFIGQRFKGWDR